MARALAESSGVEIETLTTDVLWLLAQWQGDGWLDSQVQGAIPPAPPALPAIAPPVGWPVTAPVQFLRLGDTDLRLGIDDTGLARRLDDFTSPLTHHPSTTSAPSVHVEGDAEVWQVLINGARNADGRGWEAALIATLNALIEVASRAEERLLVVHGAGLALPDGGGLLLVAPGGSGKTTLAAALNAEGLTFLNDDVVPVNWDGSLVGLKIPICLKPGVGRCWPPGAPNWPECPRWHDLVSRCVTSHPVATAWPRPGPRRSCYSPVSARRDSQAPAPGSRGGPASPGRGGGDHSRPDPAEAGAPRPVDWCRARLCPDLSRPGEWPGPGQGGDQRSGIRIWKR
jgi:hypothetical protein